jgi:hypothetical protein
MSQAAFSPWSGNEQLRIFAANLQRLEHEYTATNISDTPTLEQLQSAVTKSDHLKISGTLRTGQVNPAVSRVEIYHNR